MKKFLVPCFLALLLASCNFGSNAGEDTPFQDGSKSHPFLITSVADFEKIDDNYNKFYYYKMDSSHIPGKRIDFSSQQKKVRLNGCFDGDGVTITNLTKALFWHVGRNADPKEIVIENFNAVFNSTTGNALVFDIFNGGNTTFQNINLSGTIQGTMNMGSFYNYGTCNYDEYDPSFKGCDYTVSFVNCNSNVTLVCLTGNSAGGLIGHTYSGTAGKVSINIYNSSYQGNMKLAGGKGYTVGAIISTLDKYNGQAVSPSTFNTQLPSGTGAGQVTTIPAANPTKDSTTKEYKVALQSGVNKVKVILGASLTAVDESGTDIPNLSGITFTFNGGGNPYSGQTNFIALNPINNVEIKLSKFDENKTPSVSLEGDKLNLWLNTDDPFKYGRVSLTVAQYKDSDIVAAGSFVIAEKAKTADSWTIK